MSGYIGTQPVPQATQTRDSFTATSGQTSFATGGYTPNFLDVYLNGVKLAAADYTATNGSEVVLASGAATGDILEVVAYTTFTTADIPAGTPSIDDNGNATALTITSDEEVLIGKTTDAQQTAGTTLYQNGQIYSTVNDSQSLVLTRKTNDGALALLYKDTNEVGRIFSGHGGTQVGIGSNTTGITFNPATRSVMPADPSSASPQLDATLDLGFSSVRWRDLYLSGGVYLGGTGAANKLDDYEEGTWTPTSPTVTLSSAHGNYTKIGNRVFLDATFVVPSTSSGVGVGIQGVPFNQSNTSAAAGFYVRYTNDSTFRMLYISNGATISMYNLGGVGTALSEISGHRFDFSGTYQTDA